MHKKGMTREGLSYEVMKHLPNQRLYTLSHLQVGTSAFKIIAALTVF